MIYDITDPTAVTFKNYVNSRNYSEDIYDDVSPEGVLFVAADKNSSGAPLIIASNEVSGTVSVTALDIDAAPTEEDPSGPQTPKDEPSSSQPSEGEAKKNENGNPVSPKTGDETNLPLLIALFLISGICVPVAAVYGKKQKRSKIE